MVFSIPIYRDVVVVVEVRLDNSAAVKAIICIKRNIIY